jgi:hypothetical protein
MTWVLHCHTTPSYQVFEGMYWQVYSDKGRFIQPQSTSIVVLLVLVMCYLLSSLGAGVDAVCCLSLYIRSISGDFSALGNFFSFALVSPLLSLRTPETEQFFHRHVFFFVGREFVSSSLMTYARVRGVFARRALFLFGYAMVSSCPWALRRHAVLLRGCKVMVHIPVLVYFLIKEGSIERDDLRHMLMEPLDEGKILCL